MNSSDILNLSKLPANVRQQCMRKNTDIEALLKQQNYKGVNKAKLQSIVKSIDIPQSTDKLLLML